MKCVINSIICAFFLINFTLYSHNDETSSQSLTSRISSQIYNFGEAVNDTEIPLIGKLGNILPFGIMSFCLKEFPGQTFCVTAAALMYILYQNENFYNFLQKYNIIKKNKPKKTEKDQRLVELNDDFFVFDGDDLLDAEEQEDNEEELLEEDTDKSDHSEFRKKKTVNFL